MTRVSLVTAAWTPVAPLTGSLPLTQWKQIKATRRVVGGDDVTVTLQQLLLDEQTGVAESTRDLLVLVDSSTWVRGRISTAPEDLASDGWTGTVSAVCYGTWLDRRIVDADVTHTQVDQADIGWNLIAQTQATSGGDLGIVKGTVTAGTPRDRSYERGKNIREALDQLGAVSGGGDWWVTPDRLYRWATPTRGVVTGRVLDVRALGAQNLKVQDNSRSRCTAVWVTGAEGTTPVQALAAGGPPWPEGRIEQMQAYSDVSEQATLVSKAQLAVARGGTETWSYTMPWESTVGIDVGDTATLIARLPGQVAQRTARLVERSLITDADGRVDAEDRWLATIPASRMNERWRRAR
jgi:hypothetical protein